MRWLFLLIILFGAPGRAQALRVVAFGDSHTEVEAGMTRQLRARFHRPVAYVPYGVRGARAQDLLQGFQGTGPYLNHLAAAKALAPDIVLVAFGTNEATGVLSKGYADSYGRLLSHLLLAFPRAEVIALGPPAGDPLRVPSLGPVLEAQAGAAAMARVHWVNRAGAALPPGALGRDGVHLTGAGYRTLAAQVAQGL